MELWYRIRELRKAKNLSQEQLAEAMGVSTASVSKWETGQSLPELPTLVELADFFEISIDALVGHCLSAGKLNDLCTELDHQMEQKCFDAAQETAYKILQRYPNSAVAVRSVSEAYYRMFVCTGEKPAIEKSIELTKKRLVLEEDADGKKRFELLTELGNQYALLGDWEMSRKYYLQGNVGNQNAGALAELLHNEGRYEEAITAISDILSHCIYSILINICRLADCWENLKQYEEANAALLWGIELLNSLDHEVACHLLPLKVYMYLNLALYAEKNKDTGNANTYTEKAILSAQGQDGISVPPAFIRNKNKAELIGTVPDSPDQILEWLRDNGLDRLSILAKELME